MPVPASNGLSRSPAATVPRLCSTALVAPDLLFAECANILREKVRRGELSQDEADIAAQTLGQADIAIVSTRGHFIPAMVIAVELDHSAYDALYLP